MIKVSALTVKKLQEGVFEDNLPEFYQLKDVIENNAWHNNDVVFTHVLKVLEKLEEILTQVGAKINSYLAQKVDRNTRRDLLYLATVFHDIAKPETIEEKEGTTLCPGHEKAGAIKVQPILDTFNLSKKEQGLVTKIIEHHSIVHEILGLEMDELHRQLADFKQRFFDIYLELVLLGMADTSGSQLQENNPKEFLTRLDLYRKVLEEY